ncbi:MAG: hypothetical protein A3E01_01930 [Gammaproteobacteria bacterium RIFCSPHIGHO2_12_FULL_63_22]|nr:MAG: hypothetical protein A3E01_01930 [Gammaproteobacteria bacterium RIFCSPHIGHO2_12_FULL_63_22]
MKTIRLLALAAALSAAHAVSASSSSHPVEQPKIVSESEIARNWAPAPGAARVIAGYPANVKDRAHDVCVNIGFQINPDGSTSNFVEMKAWHSGASSTDPKAEQIRPFAQSAAAAVSLWRFAPATKSPKPVYTSTAFAFEGSKTLSQVQILATCRIDDLPGHVSAAKREAEARGSLTRAQLDRVRRTNFERRKGIQRTSRSDIEGGAF